MTVADTSVVDTYAAKLRHHLAAATQRPQTATSSNSWFEVSSLRVVINLLMYYVRSMARFSFFSFLLLQFGFSWPRTQFFSGKSVDLPLVADAMDGLHKVVTLMDGSGMILTAAVRQEDFFFPIDGRSRVSHSFLLWRPLTMAVEHGKVAETLDHVLTE